MTGAPSQAEKLRSYLNELAPEARSLLVSELEREALRGSKDLEVVLQELRVGLRGAGAAATRVGNPSRIFFKPLEPFLIDQVLPAKVRGRICRSTLAPIWSWIMRDLVPAEGRTYDEEVTRLLLSGDLDAAIRSVRTFQDLVVARGRDELARAARSEETERRLSAHLGSSRGLDELKDVLEVMHAREALTTLAGRLPNIIKNLADEALDNARTAVEAAPNEVFEHALIVLMGRLAQPWQLVRLAVKAAESDAYPKIAETPYARAVEAALSEVDRLVMILKVALGTHDVHRIGVSVKDLHDFMRGLRTDIDLAVESPWSRRLAAARKEVSALLSPHLGPVTGRIRRLLRPRAEGTPEPDPLEVDAAGRALEMFLYCRTFAGELALNELAQRVYSELHTTLDGATSALIEGLRTAEAADKPRRLAQVELAVRLSSKLFGPAYAKLLTRAAEMAAQSERKDPKAEAKPAASDRRAPNGDRKAVPERKAASS